MATTPVSRKLTADEVKRVIAALDVLEAQQRRASRAAQVATVIKAYADEADATAALIGVIRGQGSLEV